MAGLKDLAALLTDVPVEEHINVEVQPGKWAVPFQGMWLGISHSKVPPLQAMTFLRLVDGSVLIFFEDGTCFNISHVFCVKQSLEEVREWDGNPDPSFDRMETLHPWIEGLDYSKYLTIKAAQEKVASAKAEYQALMKSLGEFEEKVGDYWYMSQLEWKVPGVPSFTEWV